jgi:hypothetical protein
MQRSMEEIGRLVAATLHDETKLAALIYRLHQEDPRRRRRMTLADARMLARITREDLLPKAGE